MIRALAVSLRPAQWAKNVFVLAAPLFGRRLFDGADLLLVACAFAAFSVVSSGVYLLNDLLDRERDREHPEKRNRPIASGQLPVGVAVVALLLLIGGGVAAGLAVNSGLGRILLLYVGIQALYSTWLKRVVIVDVFCIASGFVLRVLAGAVVLDLYLSSWLILTTIFLSLFLALCKRRAESVLLEERGEDHRETLKEYLPGFLDQIIGVTTASVVLCYSLYTLDARTVAEFGTRNLVFTVPFVIFGIFRYLFLVHLRRGGASPVKTLMMDPALLVNGVAWALCSVVILYY
jgi:4-hydroxybenzoate polyprenyltransferase